jgi:serine phosphatase RsbU (regulator of sigma subunit)/ligand-binding sensor domain-containing protein
MLNRYLILLFFIFYFGNTFAKDDNFIEIISVSQGLPNANINKIFLGEKGLMWIGTANGLCFYDGYSFNTIQSVPFDSTSLADDNIRGITQNSSLNIWLQTNYGIEKINHLSGKVERVKHFVNSQDIIDLSSSPNIPDVFVLLKKGVLRINDNHSVDSVLINPSINIKGGVLVNDYLVVLEEETIYLYRIPTKELTSFKLSEPLCKDSKVTVSSWNNYVLYSSCNNLYAFNLEHNKNVLLYRSTTPIVSLSKAVDNVISFSSNKQVYKLDLSKGINDFQIEKVFALDGFNIQHSIQDKNLLIWMATNRGIVKLNPYSKKIFHKTISSTVLKNSNIDNLVYESSKRGVVFPNGANTLSFLNTTNNKVFDLPLETCTGITLIDNEYYLAGNEHGLFKISASGNLEERIKEFNNLEIYSIRELDDIIWVSTSNGLYRGIEGVFEQICDIIIDKFIVFDNSVYFTSGVGFGRLDINSCNYEILLTESSRREYVEVLDILQSFDGKIWLATDDGLYEYNPNAIQEKSDLFKLVYKGNVRALIESPNRPEVWFSTDLGIGTIDYRTQQIMFLGYEDGVRQTSFLQEGAIVGPDNTLIFMSQHESISFNPDSIFRNKMIPDVYISQVNIISEKLTKRQLYYSSDTFLILPQTRFVEFYFTTFDYFAPLQTVYEYNMVYDGEPNKWKKLKSNVLTLGAIAPGEYTLNIRAKNSHGLRSEQIKTLTIIVKAPTFRSKLAILAYFILLVLLVMSLIQLRTRTLSRKNKEYREKDRIAKKIEHQKEELTLKNKNITDSINYARRIQLAMMPSLRLFNAIFPDSFILHMPKDIVSGDFYWVNHVKNKIFFSAVDCTGHGVPGAFMSIIGVELFRRITEIEKLFTPAEVLNSLSKNFERVFGDVDEMKLRDGMDLAFCSLNEDHTLLEYAGAFNPLYIVRNNSIMEIKGDRHSVGVYEEDDELRSFNNHVIPLQHGDLVYIFTDGYVDQFGGPEGKKYKYRRFRHLLLAVHQLPLEKQMEFLKKSILEWKGDQEQVDDILVMGIRIHHEKVEN